MYFLFGAENREAESASQDISFPLFGFPSAVNWM
jgi:hypothetical protein